MPTNEDLQQAQPAAGATPTSQTPSGDQTPADTQTADGTQIAPPSFTLMQLVIGVLGLALILLVVFVGIAALQGKSNNDLNTLTSLIAGGFVGFLTPHVALPGKKNSKSATTSSTP